MGELFYRRARARAQRSLIADAAEAGGPERTRTSDLRFRKPLLYPAELRDHARCGWFRLVSGWNRCSGRRSRRGCILFSRTLVQSPYAAAPHGPPATARTPGTTKLTT